MEEALALFSMDGYESTGVAAIVAKASVTKPTLYHYFGSKEGLLRSIYEQRFNPFLDSLKKVTFDDKDILTSFQRIFECYLNYSQRDEAFFWLVNHLRKAPAKGVSYSIVKSFYDQEEAIIKDCISSISKQHKNLKSQEAFLVITCLSLINGFIEVKLLKEELEDSTSEDMLRLTKQFLYGIYSL